MYWKFDSGKFSQQNLPPLLRKKGIYALVKCLLVGIEWIHNVFSSYREGISLMLEGNAFTVNLEHFLNKLFISFDRIYIEDYRSDNVYMHFADELADDVYLGYADEDVAFYLPSSSPDNISGGSRIKVPKSLATEKNLAEIEKWVEYYRPAGTIYIIEIYE